MQKVFASWSGGKDCCLALHRAKTGGMDVRYLANMVTEDGKRSRSHGISAAAIKKQAEAAVRLVNSPEGIKAMNEAAVVAEKTIEQIGRRGGWVYFRPWGKE